MLGKTATVVLAAIVLFGCVQAGDRVHTKPIARVAVAQGNAPSRQGWSLFGWGAGADDFAEDKDKDTRAEGQMDRVPILRGVAEGLEYLRNITGPVVVVTCVGRARSGKSFTLNQLLGASSEAGGFHVSHRDVPETIGADLWAAGGSEDLVNKQVRERLGGERAPTVLVIDTEGMSAGAQKNDRALLVLAFTISSKVIYHLSETIGASDIIQLYSVAELVRHYKAKGLFRSPSGVGAGDDNVRVELPAISWVVQRYAHALPDGSVADDDKLPTSSETSRLLTDLFLKEVPNPHDDESIARFNYTVNTVRESFRDHTLHLAPSAAPRGVHPTQLAGAQLAPAYVAAIDGLRNDIVDTVVRLDNSNARKCWYTASGEWPTGPELADMLVATLDAASDGDTEMLGSLVANTISQELLTNMVVALNVACSAVKLPAGESALAVFLAERVAHFRAELVRQMPRSVGRPLRASIFATYDVVAKGIATDTTARNIRLSDTICADAALLAGIAITHSACKNLRFATAFPGSGADQTTASWRDLISVVCEHTDDLAKLDADAARAITAYSQVAAGPAAKIHAIAIDNLYAMRRQLVMTNIVPLALLDLAKNCMGLLMILLIAVFAIRIFASNISVARIASGIFSLLAAAAFVVAILCFPASFDVFPAPINSAFVSLAMRVSSVTQASRRSAVSAIASASRSLVAGPDKSSFFLLRWIRHGSFYHAVIVFFSLIVAVAVYRFFFRRNSPAPDIHSSFSLTH